MTKSIDEFGDADLCENTRYKTGIIYTLYGSEFYPNTVNNQTRRNTNYPTMQYLLYGHPWSVPS